MKNLLKSVRASLADAEKRKSEPRRIPLKKWLATQPGSTRRGVARGTFILPSYVNR
jgi:hypothetical protein